MSGFACPAWSFLLKRNPGLWPRCPCWECGKCGSGLTMKRSLATCQSLFTWLVRAAIQPPLASQSESQRAGYFSLTVIKREKVNVARLGGKPKRSGQVPQISPTKVPGTGRQLDFLSERSIRQ